VSVEGAPPPPPPRPPPIVDVVWVVEAGAGRQLSGSLRFVPAVRLSESLPSLDVASFRRNIRYFCRWLATFSLVRPSMFISWGGERRLGSGVTLRSLPRQQARSQALRV
jgi:hypothetical protein